jgi:hypothetical protein
MKTFISIKIFKMIIIISLISGIFNQGFYECTPEDKIPNDPCTEEYKPVCGWPIILYIRDDCPTTFPNRCTACRDPAIRFVTEGECIKSESNINGFQFLKYNEN